jgi:hypothetical protein
VPQQSGARDAPQRKFDVSGTRSFEGPVAQPKPKRAPNVTLQRTGSSRCSHPAAERDRRMSGRDFLLEYCDGKLLAEMLTTEGAA